MDSQRKIYPNDVRTVTETTTSTSPSRNGSDTQATVGDDNKDDNVVVGIYWDEWSRCISSRYQRDQLYRLGRLDNCSRQWKDLKTAFRAKFVQYSDPQGAEALLAKTYYRKRTTISPTAGAIWELKEQPSWN